MIEQTKDRVVTAKFAVLLPFRTSVKEGDPYEIIEKTRNNTIQVKIYPLEHIGTVAQTWAGQYVSSSMRARIDVTLPVAGDIRDFSEKESQRPFLETASHYLNLFLLHCKTKSKQFWLHPLLLNGFNMTHFQYEVQFVGDSGEVLYAVDALALGLEPLGVGINKEVWGQIKNDIISDIEPSIIDYHIEEARSAIFSESIQILLINTAVALEVFTSRFCFEYACKISKENDPYFKQLTEGPGNFAVNYFKKLIPYLTSKSLDIDKYDEIDYLFRARNKVVHEGKPFYNDKHGAVCFVDIERARRFFQSAIEIMEWLRTVDSPTADKLKCFIDTQ
jgi:hypothetical protein